MKRQIRVLFQDLSDVEQTELERIYLKPRIFPDFAGQFDRN